MSDDEATRTRPDRLRGRDRGRLRRRQRGERDTALADDHDAERADKPRWSGRSARLSPPTAGSRSTCSGTTGSHPGPSDRPAAPLSRGCGPRRRTAGSAASGCGCSPIGSGSSRSASTRRTRARQRSREDASAFGPHRLNGTPAGRSVELNERARIELRRLGPHESVRRLEGRAPGVEPARAGRVRCRPSLSLALAAGAQARHRDQGPAAEITLGYYSQQIDRGRVRIGASIDVERRYAARDGATRIAAAFARRPAPREGRRGRRSCPTATLIRLSPRTRLLLRTRSRSGPGASGTRSGRAASASTRRTPSSPATRSWARAARPEARRSIRRRSPPPSPIGCRSCLGRIRTSPRVTGLTGTDSWFWLDPAPEAEELTVSARRRDGHGDGRAERRRVALRRRGGAQRRSRSPVPRRADRPRTPSSMSTRRAALPGDQGRNPYVLGSCGSHGIRGRGGRRLADLVRRRRAPSTRAAHCRRGRRRRRRPTR